jgi:hypothetical protein
MLVDFYEEPVLQRRIGKSRKVVSHTSSILFQKGKCDYFKKGKKKTMRLDVWAKARCAPSDYERLPLPVSLVSAWLA